MRALREFLYENSLSLLFAGLFVVFLVGQSLVGYVYNNQTLTAHGKDAIGLGTWLARSCIRSAPRTHAIPRRTSSTVPPTTRRKPLTSIVYRG